MNFSKKLAQCSLFLMSLMLSTQGKNLGLKNLGNTCYANASIQALAHLPEFSESIQKMYPNLEKGSVEKLLGNVLIHLNLNKKVMIGPNALIKKTRIGKPKTQQDAAEYLSKLINNLLNFKSFFQGTLQSMLTCPHNHSSIRSEEFLILTPPIIDNQEKPITQLTQALAHFFAPEILTYKCTSCQKSEEGTKTISIKQFPQHLMIQLNRFTARSKKTEKITHGVSFPRTMNLQEYSTFSLLEYSTLSSSNHYYELTGIICQQGSMTSGHYYTYAKDGRAWYKFNDRKVTFVDDDVIKKIMNAQQEKSNSYILFYNKINSLDDAAPASSYAEVISEENALLLASLLATTKEKQELLLNYKNTNQTPYLLTQTTKLSPFHLFLLYCEELFNTYLDYSNWTEEDLGQVIQSNQSFIKETMLASELKEELDLKKISQYFRFLTDNFDINSKSGEGKSSLHYLLERKNFSDLRVKKNKAFDELFNWFAQHDQLDINIQDPEGKTPLYTFIESLRDQQDLKFAHKLILTITNKSVLDIRTNEGKNFFHLIAEKSNIQAIEVLIENILSKATSENFSNLSPTPQAMIADLLEQKDGSGKTPLDYAEGTKILAPFQKHITTHKVTPEQLLTKFAEKLKELSSKLEKIKNVCQKLVKETSKGE